MTPGLLQASEAQIAELGRAILAAVATTIAEQTGDLLLRALVDRFGLAWIRGRVDYYDLALAAVDAQADARFPR